jgi:hypothetical protein
MMMVMMMMMMSKRLAHFLRIIHPCDGVDVNGIFIVGFTVFSAGGFSIVCPALALYSTLHS